MDLGALVRRLVAGPSGAGGVTASGGTGMAPAPVPGGASGGAYVRPAWRDAPPIQRMVGAAPLVAPNAAFEARLATTRPAPLALAPLGHDRGIEAPAGLVSGIAAPVQRSPSSPMPASVRTARGARSGASPAVQRSASGVGWPDDAAAGGSFGDAPFAGESLPPEEATLASTSTSVQPAMVPASPLVTAPSAVTGLVGLIGPAAVASHAVGGSLPPAAAINSPAAMGATSTAPLVSRSLAGDTGGPIASGSLAGADASRVSSASSTASSVGDRPVRRIRVGAPLTPTVSRMVVPKSQDASATSFASPASESSGETVPVASASAAQDLSTPDLSGQAGPSAGFAAASQATAGAGTTPHAGATPLPSPAPVRLQRSVAPATASNPLVGGLRPVLTPANSAISVLRRAASETEAEGDAMGAGSSAAALAALGQSDSAAGSSWVWDNVDAASGRGGGVGSPGSPFAVEPGQGGISPARLTWTNPLADPSTPTPSFDPDVPPTSRGGAPATPTGTPSSGASFPTVSRSAAARSAAAPRSGLRVGPAMTAVTMTPSGTLGRPASQRPLRPSSPRSADVSPAGQGWDQEPVVSRAVTIDELEVTPDPSVASAESGAAAGASGSPAPSGGTTPAGAGGAASPASEAARDQETQAWADRLYDRISLRLRRDLLVERERSGALVDRGF